MVQLLQQSIAQEAMDINLAKVGYTAYYVDGANGLDTYPGDSWEQPFKTIQHAVDTAESWCTIYIRSMAFSDIDGNAAAAQPDVTVDSSVGFSVGDVVIIRDDNTTERLTIASIAGNVLTMTTNLVDTYTPVEHGIVIRVYDEQVQLVVGTTLIGENSRTTIVSPAANCAISYVDRVDSCEIRNIGAVCDEIGYAAIHLYGTHNNVVDCIVDSGGAADVWGCYVRGWGYSSIRGVKNATPILKYGVAAASGNNEIRDCEIDGAEIGIYIAACTESLVFDNTISNCTTGLETNSVGTENNTISHNNFINNTAQVDGTTQGANNHFIENHFDNHTTDTNNNGLADTVYTENSITDYQPVSRRNGWKQISLSGALSAGDASAANQTTIISGQEGGVNAVNRIAGATQIFEKSITSAATAGNVLIGTITTQPCLIKSVVLHANATGQADLTSAGIYGGAAIGTHTITFLSAADAVKANLDVADEQVGWTGAVRLAATKLLAIELLGTGATAVDLTVIVEYMATANGGYIT
jgi:parallel beta-helix repeat protein